MSQIKKHSILSWSRAIGHVIVSLYRRKALGQAVLQLNCLNAMLSRVMLLVLLNLNVIKQDRDAKTGFHIGSKYR